MNPLVSPVLKPERAAEMSSDQEKMCVGEMSVLSLAYRTFL